MYNVKLRQQLQIATESYTACYYSKSEVPICVTNLT